jgi:hypothetical protein
VLAVAGGLQRVLPDGSNSFLGGGPDPKKYFQRQIAAGPNNTLWVTLQPVEPATDPYKVARVSGLEPPVAPGGGGGTAPDTKIKKGPKKVKTRKAKAKVRFTFSSDVKGTSFECALVKKKKGRKKAPKPSFKACKSPRTYRLKPGAYKFSVRAVLNGVADPTPASRGFKVIRVRGKR